MHTDTKHNIFLCMNLFFIGYTIIHLKCNLFKKLLNCPIQIKPLTYKICLLKISAYYLLAVNV